MSVRAAMIRLAYQWHRLLGMVWNDLAVWLDRAGFDKTAIRVATASGHRYVRAAQEQHRWTMLPYDERGE